jgi:cobalt-zinc-cadmium efflux system protein
MGRAHVWTLCSNINVLDAHVHTTESDMSKIELIKKEIKRKLEKYDIKHATLEFECEECAVIDKIGKMDH